MATIVVNRELHGQESDRSCRYCIQCPVMLCIYCFYRHIELDIGDNLRYTAGDHLGVYPENAADLVQHLGERLKVNLDAVISLVPKESSLPANLSIYCYSLLMQ